jgi:intracellular multiplication protein IcmM
MSRSTWAQIKLHKNFNVNIYRVGLSFLIFSVVLSILLGLCISYIYLNEPERDFYATSGITPPVKLESMFVPNMSSNSLLDADPPADNGQRLIPQ